MDSFGALVGLLIALQGHTNFEAREAATKEVAEMGLAALPWVEGWSRHRDAEIACRCQRLSSNSNSSWIASLGKLPWITSIPCQYLLGGDYPHCIADTSMGIDEDWPGYRQATASWLLARMNSGLSREDVRAIIAEAFARDEFWKQNRRYPEIE